MADGPGRTKRLALAGFLSLAAVLGSCRDRGVTGRATVGTLDGVRLVRNPVRLASGETPPALAEDLVLGGSGESDQGLMLRGNCILDVDGSGTLYIGDREALTVFVVDAGGTLVRSIGREGQGPGEFQSLSAIRVLSDDRLAVYDAGNGRLNLFEPSGALAAEIDLAVHAPLLGSAIDSTGNVFGLETFRTADTRTMTLVKIAADGSPRRQIAALSGKVSGSGTIRLFVSLLYFALTPRDGIIWGTNTAYQLNVLDRDMRLQTVIEKADVPLDVTDEDIEDYLGRDRRAGETIIAPAHFPPWSGLQVADDGRIFVRTRERSAGGVRFAYEVFDEQGFYLYRITCPGTPLLVKAGRLYAMDLDDEGSPLLRRFVLK